MSLNLELLDKPIEDLWGGEPSKATRHACLLSMCSFAWLGVRGMVGSSPPHIQGSQVADSAIFFSPFLAVGAACQAQQPSDLLSYQSLALFDLLLLSLPCCIESIACSETESLKLEHPSESLTNLFKWCPCWSPSLGLQQMNL